MSTLARFIVEYPVVIGVFFAILFSAVRLALAPSDRKRCEWLLAASCLALPATASCELLTDWLGRVRTIRLDEYVFRIDGLFGQPSFRMGQFVAKHFRLEILANMAYSALPCAVLAVFAAYLWLRSEAETIALLRTFVLNLFLAVPIYLLIPVGGPAAAFPSFPQMPLPFVAHLISRPGPPNGFPSVHTATCLLILWFARRWPIGCVLGSLYLALMLVATLGSGQHWFFDLLGALPYSVLIARAGSIAWTRSAEGDAEDEERLQLVEQREDVGERIEKVR